MDSLFLPIIVRRTLREPNTKLAHFIRIEHEIAAKRLRDNSSNFVTLSLVAKERLEA
jgi:hypothetical protein